jgi:large subunit ribosomal protein L28e
MVAVPDQLVWELVKKNSSFIRKKNGMTKRSGAISFSVERGNLKSLNQLKSKDNRAQLVTKTASKAHTHPKKGAAVTNINKDFRRAEGIILKQSIENYYRRDLKAAALGKYTKVYQANRRAKGITKPVPVKKGRKNLKEAADETD